MNELIPRPAKVHGKVLYHGVDLYGDEVDSVEVRKRIGMYSEAEPVSRSRSTTTSRRRRPAALVAHGA